MGIPCCSSASLGRGALLLATLTFATYAVGLLRDRLFARTFGLSAELDAYNAAFVLPELVLHVLIASGVPAQRVQMIHSGIDLHRFAEIQAVPALFPAATRIIGTVGHLAGQTGAQVMVVQRVGAELPFD